MSNKLKGVWIDGLLWECEELTLLEKHFLQKIKDLDNDNGCYAMNSYFSEFFGISKGRCTQIITSLEKKGMIEKHTERKGILVSRRVLRILNKGVKFFKQGVKDIKLVVKDSKQGCLENAVSNNIEFNNTLEEYKEKEKKYKKEISLLKEKVKNLKKQLAPITDKDLQGVEFPANFTEESIEAFKMFLKMRKEIKEPFKSPTAIQTKVNSLGRDIKTYGIEAVVNAIRRSTENQWRGIKINWGKKKKVEPIKKETKKFTYDLPEFKTAQERQDYFLARYSSYKPHLDEYKKNTEYRQRAIYQQDAEGLCFELELKFPNLLDIEFNYKPLNQ